MPRPTVLVTGDCTTDYDVYRHSNDKTPRAGTPPTLVKTSFGGAGLIVRLLEAVASHPAAAADVRFIGTSTDTAPPHIAVWLPQPLGNLVRTVVDGKPPMVWRTDQTVSLGPLDMRSAALSRPAAPQESKGAAADVIVVEDAARETRFNIPPILAGLLSGDHLPRAMVLRTAAPIGHGPLWWKMTSTADLADRLVLVIASEDVQSSNVRAGVGLSWEQTVHDLAFALAHSPDFSAMRLAKHVVVTIGHEGALWMERVDSRDTFRFRLLFDAGHMSGEWTDSIDAPGSAYGYSSCFVAAITARVAAATDAEVASAVESGIERGVWATRALRVLGHGPVSNQEPSFPVREVGELLASDSLDAFHRAHRDGNLAWRKLATLGWIEVPTSIVGTADDTRAADRSVWRMLESSEQALRGAPLYGKAMRVALRGTLALANVPYARFGKFFTVDREEIEALSLVKRLMRRYLRDTDERKPLSIAVFGPPGAGKSFGIKQIAEAVIDSKKRGVLEFNLSQFNDVDDLIGAFHQVRDTALDGKLPIVFWDEFDSQGYKWLQYLLAPMQDGKFQEGQITHPIGRCVFVFAGATSYTFEHFGPADPRSPDTEDQREHRRAHADFVLKKGPDFKSRLHGFVNVLGPNPRQQWRAGVWQDDPDDVCFPVRRAVLLRSLLALMDPAKSETRLDIDPGLLGALIEIGHYKHGSRSFEKLVQSLKTSGPPYRRSGLPADEILAMNVDEPEAFTRILEQAAQFQRHADALAPAIHAQWLKTAEELNIFRKKFEELDDETRADNRAAALRIPAILAHAGLELVPSDDPRPAVSGAASILETHLDALAEEEHIGWMDVRLKNGWRAVESTDDARQRKTHREARLHDCLVPYSQLPRNERDKDQGSIRWYPRMAELAGFKIVAKGRAATRGGDQ